MSEKIIRRTRRVHRTASNSSSSHPRLRPADRSQHLNNRRRVITHNTQKSVPKALNSSLLIAVYDGYALLFGIFAIIGWAGAIVNNPLFIHQSLPARIGRMFHPGLILGILIAVTILLLILKKAHVLEENAINLLFLLSYFMGVPYLLSYRYYGSVLLPAIGFALAIAIMGISICVINKGKAITQTAYGICGLVGLVVFLVFKAAFGLTWKNVLIFAIIDLLFVFLLYNSKKEVMMLGETTKGNVIKGLITVLTSVFKALPEIKR